VIYCFARTDAAVDSAAAQCPGGPSRLRQGWSPDAEIRRRRLGQAARGIALIGWTVQLGGVLEASSSRGVLRHDLYRKSFKKGLRRAGDCRAFTNASLRFVDPLAQLVDRLVGFSKRVGYCQCRR
jgi:hypothetical protein